MTGYVERIQPDGVRGYVLADTGEKYLFDAAALAGGLAWGREILGQRVDFTVAHAGNLALAVDVRPEPLIDEFLAE